MRALRAEVPAPDPDGPPLFWSLDGGMASLVGALAAGLRARGADTCLSAPADGLERIVVGRVDGRGPPGGPSRRTPWCWPHRRRPRRALLRPHDDEVAGLLDAIDYASVVARDVPRRRGRHPLDVARHRLPRAAPQPAQGTRAVGRDGVHLPGPQVAASRPRRRGPAARLARAHRRHPRRRVERRGGRRAGLGGAGRAHGRGRSARCGAGRPASPTPSRSTGCTTCCARPASRRRWPASAVSPSPARPTTASASRPASPAGGLRHTPSCERPAAPGPRRRPLGRGRCPARALAPALGLVAPRARGCRACSTGAWPACGCGPVCGPAGWPAWGATPSASSGPAPSTGTARVVLILDRGALLRRGRGRHAAPARACPGLRGRVHPGRGVRMTWPFGGLPLGGVFLGQARGPLVELARLGGPLLITAGVWAGGVALATLAASLWAPPRPCRRPSLVGAVVIVVGLVALVVVGTVAPDGGAPVRTLRVALVQGGGQRGLSKEEVSPTTVLAAQLAATSAVATARPSPGSCCGRRTSWRSTARWPGSPQAALLEPAGQAARHDARRRRHRAGVRHQPSATRSWPGDPNGHIVGVVREGAPGALRRVRAVPLLLLALRRPLGRADRRRPRARHRPHAHAGRPARAPGVLRGLLRRAQPRVGARRRRAPGRPHQHVVLQHVAGADAGDRGGDRAGGRDRARPRPGRPDGVQRGGDPAGGRPAAQHARPAPGALRHRGAPAAASRRTTTGATSRCWLLAAVALAAGWARQLRYS